MHADVRQSAATGTVRHVRRADRARERVPEADETSGSLVPYRLMVLPHHDAKRSAFERRHAMWPRELYAQRVPESARVLG